MPTWFRSLDGVQADGQSALVTQHADRMAKLSKHSISTDTLPDKQRWQRLVRELTIHNAAADRPRTIAEVAEKPDGPTALFIELRRSWENSDL